MNTRIERGHYGIKAESVDLARGVRYSTMKTYAGHVVTSKWLCWESAPGIVASTPTGSRIDHGPYSRATEKAIREAHARGVVELEKKTPTLEEQTTLVKARAMEGYKDATGSKPLGW